jgi:hypothetical protein
MGIKRCGWLAIWSGFLVSLLLQWVNAQADSKATDNHDRLYYGAAYTPEEEEALKQAMRDLAAKKEPTQLLTELARLGFVPAEVPYGERTIVCLLPPSLLYADHTLVMLNCLLALARYPLQQPVKWQDLPEDAKQAVLQMIETQLPFNGERRQWVLSHLDDVEVSLKYSVALTDKTGMPVAFYDPPWQKEVVLPDDLLRWRALGSRPGTRASVVRGTGRVVELLSETVELNYLERLREVVYKAALAHVREQNRRALVEVLEGLLKPCRSGIEKWIGKQVEARELDPAWLAGREIDGQEKLRVEDEVFFCIRTRALPGEGSIYVTPCIAIGERAIGSSRGARD